MVDEREILKQYSYKATSNLVLEQENRRSGRDGETDEVVPLKIGALPGRMGDKAMRPGEKSTELKERLDRRRERTAKIAKPHDDALGEDQITPAVRKGSIPGFGTVNPNANVVDVANELELDTDGAAYVPTTLVSQRAFEAILAFVMSKLGDQPRELLRSAAEEALSILKDQQLQELERKKNIERMLAAKLENSEFDRLSMLGRKIKDFGVKAAAPPPEMDAELIEKEQMDEEQGVAVVFDDDEDAASNEDLDEVVEIDDHSIPSDEEMQGVTPATDADGEAIDRGQKDEILQLSQHLSSKGALSNMDGKKQKPEGSLDPHEVDGYWLQRTLSAFYTDAPQCQKVAEQVLEIISSPDDDRSCENRLVILLEFDKFDFIKLVLENRATVVFCTRLARAKDQNERLKIEEEMLNTPSGTKLLQILRLENEDNKKQDQGVNIEPVQEKKPKKRERSKKERVDDDTKMDIEENSEQQTKHKFSLRRVDLESLSFAKGGRLMSVKDCSLPTGSEHFQNKDYEEWFIPATRAKSSTSDTPLVSISSLPEWSRPAFQNTRQLNRMQSSVFPCAFQSDENMLVCAPTGAGKTNVAVLSVLRAIQNSMKDAQHTNSMEAADLNSFKVVYVAPMKALVAEVVENLGRRLGNLGLSVRELTGDINLSGEQVNDTQVIVTTPEKWDIITRKSGERAYTQLVRLLIVDEIHLLHDERGPVLEAIIARTIRSVESFTAFTRIVGLSATLPNYKDVADFLRVHPKTGLFYFGPSHRPCPLQQNFVGITAKKALKRFQLMNDLTYEKVKQQVQSSNQIIVFVHSRKETAATCRVFIDKAIDEEITDLFLKPGTASHEIVQAELPEVDGKDLANLLEHGLGIHHAGMTRNDRQLVEALFEAGHIKVLVSTATLAWGVNLPAHAVVIKGTQVYSPEHGRWIELSSMDVMQMMGRAGRPQFDTRGEGIIITTKADVLYYLSLLNHQLPIESQVVTRLVDMVNAEVALGSISSVEEGASWLCYTYFYIRMLKNPALYSIPADEHQRDKHLERRRQELIHAAVSQLHRSGLVKYNKKTGSIEGTDLGRVASDFYVSHKTISTYLENMKPTTTDIDLLHLFSLSGEFRHMRVREEEKLELSRLAERVPIPIKESLDEPTAKVNVLLQSYISNMALDGLALKADMLFVTQSAARLARALLQVSIQMKWAAVMEKCLRLCKVVAQQQWSSQTPLRQFGDILAADVLHKIERKELDFERYYDLSVSELAELLRDPRLGKKVHRLVHSLPRLELSAQVRPLSRSTIEIDLTLSPDFRFDGKVHRSGEAFWISVEDCDSEILLYSELFFLRGSLATEEHKLNFTVPLTTPQPPHYFIRCTSDRWIVPETILPISFQHLLLPDKFSSHTKLLGMRPLSVHDAFQFDQEAGNHDGIDDIPAYQEALQELRTYFRSRSRTFTTMQTQLFQSLFQTDENVVLATLPGNERDICAELCIARTFSRKPTAVAVWIAGRGEIGVHRAQKLLSEGIGKFLGLNVGKFISDGSAELNLLRTPGTIVVTTARRWDMFSRKWKLKKEGRMLKKISSVILEDAHLLSEDTEDGAALEVVGSRMRYIAADAAEDGEPSCRIVAITDPVANAKEIGHWLGCPPAAVFSFDPRVFANNITLDVVSAVQRSGGVLGSPAATMIHPVYRAIRKYIGASSAPVVVFVPSRKITRALSLEIIGMTNRGGSADRFLHQSSHELQPLLEKLKTNTLRECLALGVAYIHDGLPSVDREVAEQLFHSGTAQILVTTAAEAWRPHNLNARLIVVAGTSKEDAGGYAVCRAEYSHTDLLRMICCGNSLASEQENAAVVITEKALHEHYKRFCFEPLAVESQLSHFLADHLNAEVVSGVVETKQDAVDYLTWTFFYRRLPKNPNYYGMRDLSHLQISKHLSELVETALSDLEASKCVAAEGDEDVALGTLNLGIIASHYYMRHATVELFASSMTPGTRLKGLLDILSLASEFSKVPVRIGDEELLGRLATQLPISLQEDGGEPLFSSPHVKTHLLLQAQLSRKKLSVDLMETQYQILPIATRLLRAMIDVISSAGWLKPALAAVELSQMLVQGLWDSDSPLMQLPHVDQKIATSLESNYEVSDIFDFLNMEPEDRSNALSSLSNAQVMDIAAACQQFPNLDDLEIESVEQSSGPDGVSITRVIVSISRNIEDDDEELADGQGQSENASNKVPLVTAPRFPNSREEGWWVIVGEPTTNTLLTVKYVALKQKAKVKLDFESPRGEGKHALKLSLLSDSYIDCDQEENFELIVSTPQAEIEPDVDGPETMEIVPNE